MWGQMRFSQPKQVRRGMTPQESYWMEKIEKEAASRKQSKASGYIGFVEQMKQRCELGSKRNLDSPCCYIFENKAVAQIELHQWQYPNGRKISVLFLTKLYVLDIHRDEGIGTKFIQEIKRCVDEAGLAIYFFASSFSLSNEDGGLPFAFTDMDHLLKYWELEYLTFNEDQHDLLSKWYLKQGFLNACVHDLNFPAQEHQKLSKQFIHVGKNCYDYDLLMNRTNESGMCDFCREQIDT